MRSVKVGSRDSRLALAQTGLVLKQLQKQHPDTRFVIVPIKTAGDRIATASELRQAGKGVFVKELERALLSRKIDIAVHSMKDLPSELPEGLVIGAVPERVDPSDVFISKNGVTIDKLLPGAQVGTSSLRRQAILKSIFPRLKFVELRGNLDTRLEKLKHPRSPLGGIVVAAAGLQRLYPQNGVPVQVLPRAKVVPAAGQGALALEIRGRDAAVRELLAPIHHPDTAACVEAERDLLRRLEGGCSVPLGAYAELSGDGIMTLTACLATLDGRRLIRESAAGTMDNPAGVAEALETVLNSHGAQEILAQFRPKAPVRRPAKPHRNGQARARRPARRPRPRARARARSRR